MLVLFNEAVWDVVLNISGTIANSFELTSSGLNDLTSAIAALPHGYHNGARFAMNAATLYGNIYNRVDNTGSPIFLQNAQTDSVTKLLGFDLILDGFIPTGTVLFGNFAYYGLNMPQGIAIERSVDSGFSRGVFDYRALAIVDAKPLVNEAFIKLEAE